MRTRKEIEEEQQYANEKYEKLDTVIAHTQALQLETLLDIRELLMLQQEVFDPIPSTPCICYDLLGKINSNCPIHHPTSKKETCCAEFPCHH